MALQISDEPRFWADSAFAPYHMGVFYFVVPERAIFSQPVKLLDFVSHQTGRRQNPSMAQIEALQADQALFPPKR